MAKQRAEDEAKVKEVQNKRKGLSLAKKRETGHKQLKQDQNQWQKKHRKVENRSDRLREFREATKYNAIFICTCCEQRMFHSNIRLYTQDLRNELNKNQPGHTEKCVRDITQTWIAGEGKTYICLTCVRHMKKNKLPPMSAMNGLELTETDEIIVKQGLKLTELEGALIAKSIIFQKIYQLPKSRWTALKDRLINIPINDEDIINTLEWDVKEIERNRK